MTPLYLTHVYSSITIDITQPKRNMRMPKTYTAVKPVRSFRLSSEGVNQLRAIADVMGRSESSVVEIALDRMYREEVRFNRTLRETPLPGATYQVKNGGRQDGKKID